MSSVSVSTTFFPSARLLGVAEGQSPDIMIRTCDFVFFYCHQSVLRGWSSNHFNSLLQPDDQAEILTPHPILTRLVPENAAVMNVVLHTVYRIPVEKYGPSVSSISLALNAIHKYGFWTPDASSDIWTILKRHAVDEPFRVYALGAYSDIESVCEYASEFTLGKSLSALSEQEVLIIGPKLLRRLFFLHLGRQSALKRIISSPPETHAVTQSCSVEDQAAITGSWKAATGEVLLDDMTQNIALGILVSAFGPLASATHCMQCKINIQYRMSRMIEEWEAVKKTI